MEFNIGFYEGTQACERVGAKMADEFMEVMDQLGAERKFIEGFARGISDHMLKNMNFLS